MFYSSVALITFAFLAPITTAAIPPTSREDAGHFVDDASLHDVKYDHEAFLGEQKSKEYSQFTREENAEKLKEIVKRIDTDSDGFVTEDEMSAWITMVADKSTREITDRQWASINKEQKDSLTWKEYADRSHGTEEDRKNTPGPMDDYYASLKNDKRRFDAADVNKDGSLDKKEFHVFLHPQDQEHMREVLIEELMETIDTDGDHFITEDEYIADMARAYGVSFTPGKDTEPDWATRERDQFRKHRDADQNGKMDKKEVGEWIMPTGYDSIEAETKHLFYHTDLDKDDRLTEEEIMKQQDLFVGSQATNYGNELKEHVEL